MWSEKKQEFKELYRWIRNDAISWHPDAQDSVRGLVLKRMKELEKEIGQGMAEDLKAEVAREMAVRSLLDSL